jgi:hypothetical protein
MRCPLFYGCSHQIWRLGGSLGRGEWRPSHHLRHLKPDRELAEDERKAISAVTRMLEDIADVKERRGSRFVLSP